MKNESLQALNAMFPTCDVDTIETVLASHHGHIEKTIEDLLKIAPQEDPASLNMNSQYSGSRLAKPKPNSLYDQMATRDQKYSKKRQESFEPEYEPYSEAIAESQANEFQIMTDEELAQEMFKMEKRKDLEMYERAQSWFGLKKTYYDDEKKKPGLVKKLTGAFQKKKPTVEVPVKGNPIVAEPQVISPKNPKASSPRSVVHPENSLYAEEEKSFEVMMKVASKKELKDRVELLEMPEDLLQQPEQTRRSPEISYKMPSSQQLREPRSVIERQEIIQNSQQVRRNAEMSYRLPSSQQVQEPRSLVDRMEMSQKPEQVNRNAEMSYRLPPSQQIREPSSAIERPEIMQNSEQVRRNAEMSYRLPSSQQLQEPRNFVNRMEMSEQVKRNAEMSYRLPSTQQIRDPRGLIERQEMTQGFERSPADISLNMHSKQQSDPEMSIMSLNRVVNTYKKTENVDLDKSSQLLSLNKVVNAYKKTENVDFDKSSELFKAEGAQPQKTRNGLYQPLVTANNRESRYVVGTYSKLAEEPGYRGNESEQSQEVMKLDDLLAMQEESRVEGNYRGPAESRSNLFALDDDKGQEDSRVQGNNKYQEESRSNLFAYDDERDQEDSRLQGNYRGPAESRSNLFAYDDEEEVKAF